jgi:hypothetical protein
MAKLKVIPKNVVKAFAIASTIGAVLKSNQTGEPKLVALQVQVLRAMRVFNKKAGSKTYWNISLKVADVWEKITERHNNTIKEEEVPKFVEYLCMTIPPKDFKEFFAIKAYSIKDDINPETNKNILDSILMLNDEINKISGTRSYSLPITRAKPVVEKEKKKRDVSKKQKSSCSGPTRKQVKERERHSNVKSFLQKKIEEAKAKKEE